MTGNTQHEYLQRIYWLHDNALYGEAAFLQYLPAKGVELGYSWRRHWDRHFPSLCREGSSDYVVGRLPVWDDPARTPEPRCRFAPPRPHERYRLAQFPDPPSTAYQARACAEARKRINDACFGAGDDGHEEAEEGARRIAEECARCSNQGPR